MSRLLCRSAAVLLLLLSMAAAAQHSPAGPPPGQVPGHGPGASPGVGQRHVGPGFRNAGMDPRAMDARQHQHRTMSEAVRRVQRHTGGQILGAEVVSFEGRDIHRIKYMDDRGRVRYMDDPGPSRMRPRRRDHVTP